jgi:hypothetical protein
MAKRKWTNIDPSRTKTERQRFMREMKRRLKLLRKEVWKWLVIDDELGLEPRKPFQLKQEKKLQQKNRRQYAFLTDPQKMQEFQTWLQRQVDGGLLEVDNLNRPWTSKYVTSSWRKGMMRSYTDVRKQGFSVTPDWYGGTKEQWLRSAFLRPEMMSKVELLGTRAFESMKDITSTISSQMSRVLADGMANGYGPTKIARTLDRQVFAGRNRARAMTIARTEIIHAHAEGQLDGLEDLGIEKVKPQVEISTAGDGLVCDICNSFVEQVYTTQAARGIIPIHPNCRCAWMPVIDEKSSKAEKIKDVPKQDVPSMPTPYKRPQSLSPTTAQREENIRTTLSQEKFAEKHQQLSKDMREYFDKQVPGWNAKGLTLKQREEVEKKFLEAIKNLKASDHSLFDKMAVWESKAGKSSKEVKTAAIKKLKQRMDLVTDESYARYNNLSNVNIYRADGNIRAGCNVGQRYINFSKRESASTVYHEFGHLFESYNTTAAKSRAWRNWRSGTAGVGDLGDMMWKGMRGETAKIDKFISPYVGRLSPTGNTEVMSMAFQNFASDRSIVSFAKKDFDHFSFFLEVLNGLI